jgi:hypothetical protein
MLSPLEITLSSGETRRMDPFELIPQPTEKSTVIACSPIPCSFLNPCYRFVISVISFDCAEREVWKFRLSVYRGVLVRCKVVDT